jgi:hypothetical protein
MSFESYVKNFVTRLIRGGNDHIKFSYITAAIGSHIGRDLNKKEIELVAKYYGADRRIIKLKDINTSALLTTIYAASSLTIRELKERLRKVEKIYVDKNIIFMLNSHEITYKYVHDIDPSSGDTIMVDFGHPDDGFGRDELWELKQNYVFMKIYYNGHKERMEEMQEIYLKTINIPGKNSDMDKMCDENAVITHNIQKMLKKRQYKYYEFKKTHIDIFDV